MNAALPNPQEIFHLPEVAEMLRCSIKTVRRLIEDGKLRACKLRGRVVVEASALAEYWASVTAPKKLL